MTALLRLHDAAFARAEAGVAPWAIPTLARFVFAATLLVYFWASALTKLGPGLPGLLRPDPGAYIQILPRAFEAAGYNPAAMGWGAWAVVVAGTWAEFILPLLIVIGLATRLASLGMIGFVVAMSLTDIFGHGVDAAAIGAWFDKGSGAPILDQRAFWVFLLAVLALTGAGPLSADALLRHARGRRAPGRGD
jgi:putative oxidoreductase